MGEQPCPRLQKPHPNWRFDDLLVDLSTMINDTDELNTLKEKFHSDFRKKKIGEITSTRALFTEMKQRELIDANNIIYLQAILMKLKRPELIKRTVEYCQSANKVLYFNPVAETPENGHGYVGFDLYLDKEYTGQELTQLKSRVAEILNVNVKLVSAPSDEPSSSLQSLLNRAGPVEVFSCIICILSIMANYIINGVFLEGIEYFVLVFLCCCVGYKKTPQDT